MAQYSDLILDHFYLIKEAEEDEIVLVQPLMATDNCVLLQCHDDLETTFWRKKTDAIAELVDELTDEQLADYENLFEDEEGTDWEEQEL
ncbi:hypothetical protein ACI6Q2_01405 [Chitinophagaceae bacterium LWZ2-11]